MIGLIISLLFAAGVGYVAGQFMGLKGPWYVNILLGLAGGLVGHLVFGVLGFSVTNIIGEVISSVVGACLVIFAYNKFLK